MKRATKRNRLIGVVLVLKFKPLRVWKRWLKIKTLNWWQIGLALRDLARSSERADAKMRLWTALAKLDFVPVHEMLQDLIRFPPY